MYENGKVNSLLDKSIPEHCVLRAACAVNIFFLVKLGDNVNLALYSSNKISCCICFPVHGFVSEGRVNIRSHRSLFR